MSHALVLCLALLASASAQQIRDDGDDGSYNADKYEKPFEYNSIYEQEQQPQQYQSQPQAYQPQAYQPQPQSYQPQAYQAQPQSYQPQPQSYQPQPAPVYRPAPQTYARPVTDSRNAAILSEARYLQNDGKFGASYSQEDGVEFKEESDPDGTRRGTYSYVDPSGQRRTVSYTAGKQGFIATGDHLPQGPAPVAAAPAPQSYQPAPAARAYQPQPQSYQPQPQSYQPSQGGLNVANGGFTYNSQF